MCYNLVWHNNITLRWDAGDQILISASIRCIHKPKGATPASVSILNSMATLNERAILSGYHLRLWQYLPSASFSSLREAQKQKNTSLKRQKTSANAVLGLKTFIQITNAVNLVKTCAALNLKDKKKLYFAWSIFQSQEFKDLNGHFHDNDSLNPLPNAHYCNTSRCFNALQYKMTVMQQFFFKWALIKGSTTNSIMILYK